MLSLRLPEELQNRLEKFVSQHDNSKSYYVKQAIETYLDDMEDAEEAMQRMSDPNAKYMTTDELLSSLDV